MKHLFTINAPDGTVEHVGQNGEVLYADKAVPFEGTVEEAHDASEGLTCRVFYQQS